MEEQNHCSTAKSPTALEERAGFTDGASGRKNNRILYTLGVKQCIYLHFLLSHLSAGVSHSIMYLISLSPSLLTAEWRGSANVQTEKTGGKKDLGGK